MAGKRKRTDGPADGSKVKKSKGGPPKRPEPEEPSALPEPLETPEDVTEETAATPKKDTKKKEKTPKKTKTEKAAKSEETNGTAAAEDAAPSTKSKKNKKKKAEAAEGAEETAEGETAVAADGKKAKAARFIVFVGNLPYTASAATIRQHFASVKPSTVRCLQKDGEENTCRGFAFIEFSDPTNMRTCLDKMHHSMFNDGLSAARKINVELTYVPNHPVAQLILY